MHRQQGSPQRPAMEVQLAAGGTEAGVLWSAGWESGCGEGGRPSEKPLVGGAREAPRGDSDVTTVAAELATEEEDEGGEGAWGNGKKSEANSGDCTSSALAPVAPPPCLLQTNLSALRFRRSCYFDATVRWGVRGFVPYNHMLLPVAFEGPEAEYACLKSAVCLWDVAAQRQVELVGPDALRLAELATPRALGGMKVGECRYAVATDAAGMVLNDPVVLRLAEDHFWFSLADSDLLLWLQGLAAGLSLDVRVSEPSVSPLAVQGPRSLDLLRDLFGDWVEDLKFFHFREAELAGIPLLVARSGWSPERGYELYLRDEARGDELWERVMRAGRRYGIRPGAPNQIRRIEGGLLSFGSDLTRQHHVLELGLPPKWCSADKAAAFVGRDAVRRALAAGGPPRRVVGLELRSAGDVRPGPLFQAWPVLDAGGKAAFGHATSACFSPAMGATLAIATLEAEAASPGTEVLVQVPGLGRQAATVRRLPFLPRAD